MFGFGLFRQHNSPCLTCFAAGFAAFPPSWYLSTCLAQYFPALACPFNTFFVYYFLSRGGSTRCANDNERIPNATVCLRYRTTFDLLISHFPWERSSPGSYICSVSPPSQAPQQECGGWGPVLLVVYFWPSFRNNSRALQSFNNEFTCGRGRQPLLV